MDHCESSSIRRLDRVASSCVSAALIFSILKGVFFGVTITFIGCYVGLQAEGGAAGVGRTARNTVVAIIVALMVLDVVLAPLYKAVG